MAKRRKKDRRVPFDVMFASAGMPGGVTEWKFHDKRKWRLDLAYPSYKVGLEVHGGIWRFGRHVSGDGFQKDREKMNEAQLLGWIIIEVSTGQLAKGMAFDFVRRALELRGWHGC